MENETVAHERACKPETEELSDVLKNPAKEVPPMMKEHLFVITELAKIGLQSLNQLLTMNKDSIEKVHYEHFKGLAEIAGPETVSHFDRICQFLFEQDLKESGEPEKANESECNNK